MTKELIEHIYQELKRIGSCKSRSQFSLDWCGREEGYYRNAVSHGGTISVSAQAHLCATLRNIGMCFGRGDFPFLVPKGHVLLDLHSRCLEDLFARVTLNAAIFETE
jgi:hypothetical protein